MNDTRLNQAGDLIDDAINLIDELVDELAGEPGDDRGDILLAGVDLTHAANRLQRLRQCRRPPPGGGQGCGLPDGHHGVHQLTSRHGTKSQWTDDEEWVNQ